MKEEARLKFEFRLAPTVNGLISPRYIDYGSLQRTMHGRHRRTEWVVFHKPGIRRLPAPRRSLDHGLADTDAQLSGDRTPSLVTGTLPTGRDAGSMHRTHPRRRACVKTSKKKFMR